MPLYSRMDSILCMRAIHAVAAFCCLSAMLIISSCGSSKKTTATEENEAMASPRYVPSTAMTNDVVTSKGGEFAVKLPADWQDVYDETNAPNISLWLLRDDNAASISFIPITMDPALHKALARDGLQSVANVSLNLKRDRLKESLKIVMPMEPYRMHGRDYYAYEYTFDGGKTIVRVVVFDTGRQFVECAAMPARENFTASETTSLFIVQQSILASLTAR